MRPRQPWRKKVGLNPDRRTQVELLDTIDSADIELFAEQEDEAASLMETGASVDEKRLMTASAVDAGYV